MDSGTWGCRGAVVAEAAGSITGGGVFPCDGTTGELQAAFAVVVLAEVAWTESDLMLGSDEPFTLMLPVPTVGSTRSSEVRRLGSNWR